MSEHAFARLHPASNFLFFALAMLLGMFFVNPLFLSISALFSLSYYIVLRGAKGLKSAGGILLAASFISLVSPLLSTYGDKVIFTYGGGRPYTQQALLYGISTGGMFVTVAFWFACYNIIITSEKFMYLFDRLAPTLSLVLSMVLRLVPALQKNCGAVLAARNAVGKSPQNAAKYERICAGATVLSVVISMSLESAIITADSMRCRGYGTTRRTSFAQYKKGRGDVCFIMITAACALVGAYAALCAQKSNWLFAAAYAAFLSQPLTNYFWEEIKWRVLRSKI